MVANPSWDPNGAWVNTLDEEFPGPGLSSTWQPGWFTASGTSNAVNSGEDHGYDAANVSVSGGLLNLTKTSTTGAIVVSNPLNTGTATGFQMTPPVAYECRMNVPGSGTNIYYWPAFWSNGQNWPSTGEIDVMEGLGGTTAVHIHDSANPNGIGQDTPVSAGFHTFGAYWTTSQVQFFYDGTLVATEPTDGFTGPHYLICQFTRNSSVPFNHGNQTVQVDWVRVWTPGTATTTGMTVTATASGSQSASGIDLAVRVLTGATTSQAGATAHSEALSVPSLALTPLASGSVVYGAMANGTGAQFTAPDATTTFFSNLGDSASQEGYLLFRGTGTTTAGQAVTTGATGPGPTGQMLGVVAEIQASGTIAEDPSSPPVAFAEALTVTTAGFTPPGGAVLVAIVSANYNTAGTPTVNVAVSDSTGLTWTQLIGNAGGQDLCSVWIAGASQTPTPPPPPITGPPATARPLIVSAAPAAGVDTYGNTFPKGIQVGASTGTQVLLLPGSGVAEVQFPVPAPLLSNVANIASATSATFADLIFSGPALAAAGVEDWVQLLFVTNDNAGHAAHMEFRAIDTTGAVTVTAQYNGQKWLFGELVVAAGTILAQDPANPGSFEPWHSLGNFPSGTTTRGQYRLTPMGELELDISLTGTPAAGSANFPNTMPAAYRPAVTKRLVIAQGGTLGICTINTTGVVGLSIGAGGSATADVAGRVNLS